MTQDGREFAAPHHGANQRATAQAGQNAAGGLHSRQALAVGVTRAAWFRRSESGEVIPLGNGVFRLASWPPSWKQEVMAETLRSKNLTVASHRTAARLLKLDGIGEPVLEFTMLGSTGVNKRRGIVHRTRMLDPCDVTIVEGIPTTTAARTLVDLGAVVDKERVELCLEDALRRGLTSLARLQWRLGELCGSGRHGISVLRELLDERPIGTNPTESGLETKVWRLIYDSRLPLPIRQFEVVDNGRFVARPDFAYPEVKVAVEADSYKWHGGRAAWQRELRRRNALQRLGWLVVHVTEEDVRTRPEAVIDEVAAALRSRGMAV